MSNELTLLCGTQRLDSGRVDAEEVINELMEDLQLDSSTGAEGGIYRVIRNVLKTRLLIRIRIPAAPDPFAGSGIFVPDPDLDCAIHNYLFMNKVSPIC